MVSSSVGYVGPSLCSNTGYTRENTIHARLIWRDRLMPNKIDVDDMLAMSTNTFIDGFLMIISDSVSQVTMIVIEQSV